MGTQPEVTAQELIRKKHLCMEIAKQSQIIVQNTTIVVPSDQYKHDHNQTLRNTSKTMS